MSAKKKPVKGVESTSQGFTAEERAAMRERAQELKAAARREDGEQALLEKLAEMEGSDRAIGERLHEIITAAAPGLIPKTWYGMPAYEKDGKVVCFFQGADKFKARYATLGFNDAAQLDDGPMWPTAFALIELDSSVEARILELIEKAVS